jgi:hypothetical protein
MGNPIRLSLLAGAASACALALATPAAAQYRSPYPARNYQDTGMDSRIGQLRVRLDAEYRRGIIGRGEVARLRARLDEITRLQRVYYRNGLNAAERADLDRRIRDFRLAFRLAADRGGGNGRGTYDRDDDGRDDYGRDEAYGRDDDVRAGDEYRRGNADGRGDIDDDDDDYRSDDRIDSDRDGWDDRDRDRDGRWEDDSPEVGVNLSTGMLRVGQRAGANLGGVPSQYRDRYRDGGGVYYRSDGRAIYQIDARTNAVVRIYAIGR